MQITKDQFNALSDAEKALFKAEGDGYKLVTPAPTPPATPPATPPVVPPVPGDNAWKAEVERLRAEHAKLQADAEKARSEATREKIAGEVRRVFLSKGGRENAADDVTRDLTGFEIKDGKVVGPLAKTVDQYVAELATQRDYLFKPSTGAGLAGNLGTGAGGVNPYKKDTWNATEQFRLEKNQPAIAKQFKAEAGKVIMPIPGMPLLNPVHKYEPAPARV